jgi:hypothetical protein
MRAGLTRRVRILSIVALLVLGLGLAAIHICADGGAMASAYRTCDCRGLEWELYDRTAADGPRRTLCLGWVRARTCHAFRTGPVVACSDLSKLISEDSRRISVGSDSVSVGRSGSVVSGLPLRGVEKPPLRAGPDGAGVGLGGPHAGAQSVGPLGNPCAGDESPPPLRPLRGGFTVCADHAAQGRPDPTVPFRLTCRSTDPRTVPPTPPARAPAARLCTVGWSRDARPKPPYNKNEDGNKSQRSVLLVTRTDGHHDERDDTTAR